MAVMSHLWCSGQGVLTPVLVLLLLQEAWIIKMKAVGKTAGWTLAR